MFTEDPNDYADILHLDGVKRGSERIMTQIYHPVLSPTTLPIPVGA